MLQRALTLSCLTLCLVCAPTLAQLTPEALNTVANAVALLDAADQDNAWLFTLRVVEDSEERIVTHDPRKAPHQQRTLISVDGAPPSDKRLKAFAKQEKKRVDERDPNANYAYLIDLTTLRADPATRASTDPLGERQQRLLFSPRVQGLEDVRDKLSGTLLVDQDSGSISEVTVFNKEAFSPAFSVTLETYQLTMTFSAQQGAVLLHTMRSYATGKAGFVKRFENTVDVEFLQFTPAASAE